LVLKVVTTVIILRQTSEMEQKNDIWYIERVLKGDTQYFSHFVEKYKDIVFSIALKVLRNREDAEEMAQESFVKAFKSLHTFKGDAKFSTWLYRITYNNCISELRKKKLKFVSTDDVQISDEVEEMNFDGIPEENRAKYVKAALEKLPEDEYTLILLYYFEDKSVEEISEITKLTESNAKVKLFRARKKLHTILNEMLKEDIYTIL
jgi:RNA polymerase sigma-70 factor (ECF subfamily)